MQLLPGGGDGSDLGKALTLAALGAGAYYGFGGLAGAAEGAAGGAAFLPASQTAIAQGVGGAGTAAALDIAAGIVPAASAGVSTSILKGIKDAAPLAAVGLSAGALTPRMPGFPDLPAIPSRADEAVSEARRKQMEIDKLRKGRAASILTGSRGVEGELGSVSRPAARAAQLLGD